MVLSIVDASNLERNLFLVSQVLSLGLPTVVALNMVDLARDRQIEIDVEALAQRLGVPVIAVQANRRVGIEQLAVVACLKLRTARTCRARTRFRPSFNNTRREFAAWLNANSPQPVPTVSRRAAAARWRRLLGRRTAERHRGGRLSRNCMRPANRWPRPACRCRRSKRWPATTGSPACSTACRAGRTIIEPTTSDRIDAVLTHKIWGTLIFIAAMALLFSSIFVLAVPLMDLIDGAMDWLGEFVVGLLARWRACSRWSSTASSAAWAPS